MRFDNPGQLPISADERDANGVRPCPTCGTPHDAADAILSRTAEPDLLAIAMRLANLAGDTGDVRLAQAARLVAEVAEKPVERTPEVVLRAMLAAYEKAALEAEKALCRDRRNEQLTDVARAMHLWVGICRMALADVQVSNQVYPETLGRMLRDDYEARLVGTRPLDAPPPEGN